MIEILIILIVCSLTFLLSSYLVNRKSLIGISSACSIYGMDGCLLLIYLLPFIFFHLDGFCGFAILILTFFTYFNLKILKECSPKGFKGWWQLMNKHKYFALIVCLIIAALALYLSPKFGLAILCWCTFLIFLNCLQQSTQYFLQSQTEKYNNITHLLITAWSVVCFFLNLATFFLLALCSVIIALEIFDPKGMAEDICLDTGYCEEGIMLNGCFGKESCVINKQTCLQMNGKWLEEARVCQLTNWRLPTK